ncbi:CotH kinase family protein, partial [archaeon]
MREIIPVAAVLAVALVAIVGTGLFLPSAGQPDATVFSSNLPIVVIDTFGGDIVDEPKIGAGMKIIYDEAGKRNYLGEMPVFDGPIGIEVRGATSQGFPKKQYGIETRDENGNSINLPLFGFPRESDWVLYAPYTDKSLMRNHLAYTLSRQMGHYASRTMFVELFLNGTYDGVYVFMENVRKRSHIGITPLTEEDNKEPGITGGYVLRLNWVDKGDKYFVTEK